MTFCTIPAAANSNDPIVLGDPDWPGIWAKNAVVANILENIGYEVEIKSLKNAIIYQGMLKGDVDIYLGSWMPSDKPTREGLDGDLEVVRKNLKEGLYTLGVPEYAWEAGVKSFADLDDYAEKFDHKLYVGPVGWEFTTQIKKAVKNDVYGLGDWELVNSSQTAMIANMKKAMAEGEWIATLAWKPHWMNYVMDIKYLEDPKDVWVNAESWVDTLTRQGFDEEQPEVYKFLTQFEVTNEMSNEWIYYIGYEDEEPEKVADKWVKNNLDVIEGWLEGVKASNGKDAFTVLKNNISN
jgi:glycine betaine/proline transport system substrate-binding protein